MGSSPFITPSILQNMHRTGINIEGTKDIITFKRD